MILVTGSHGFIGSNFVRYLNSQGITDIVVSDYLTNGKQFKNLNGTKYIGFCHPDSIVTKDYDIIFHFGAVSSTTCWDGELVMKRNYEFTKRLIDSCIASFTRLSYSSSASVYGNGEGPLNLYAYSKWLVDQYVERLNSPLIQGFRYFNVYSTDESEWHKGNQASPQYKFRKQAEETGKIEIFEGSAGYLRDFIHVSEVCRLQYEMSKTREYGVFDLGSGEQKSFAEIAQAIAKETSAKIVEIPFPKELLGTYQTNTSIKKIV